VLTSLRGAEQTGFYAVATSIAEWPVMAIQSLTTVLLPGIGASGERNRERLALVGLGGALIFSALAACGLALVVGWLTPRVYGNSFSASVAPALVLLQGIPGLAVTRVGGTISVAHGHPGQRTGAALIGLAATIALDLLWIPEHGAVGAAWASLCSYVLSAAAAVLWIAPLLHRSPGRLLTDSIGTTVGAVQLRFAGRSSRRA
jgi:O-antigen/teichoic acid export membrane protein